jgi:3',5'-cyclic AMP phosphodiesterase CpdA
MRLAHISDLHVPVKRPGWGVRDLFTKRTTGWINVRLLGRGRRFRHAREVVQVLRRTLVERGVGHVLFSGDASMMGFSREFDEVANLLGVKQDGGLSGLAVPGNHDYYVRRSQNSRSFERAFEPWQRGVRLDESHVYPFAQQVGGVWFVAVNSARSNVFVWDARGGVGRSQRDRLVELLRSLSPGRKVLVTHYPLLLANGKPETRWRLLRDWKEMRALAIETGISLWLHGHRHHSYLLPASDDLPFPCICVGSSTQTNRWSYNEYRFEGDLLHVLPRQFDPIRNEFVDGTPSTLRLPLQQPD